MATKKSFSVATRKFVLSWFLIFSLSLVLTKPAIISDSRQVSITGAPNSLQQILDSGSVPAPTSTVSLIDYLRQIVGCQKFQEGECIQCRPQYFLSRKGTCDRLSSNCQSYNIPEGTCIQCFSGFRVIDGLCYGTDTVNPLKNHCVLLGTGNQGCLRCEKRYYLNSSTGECHPIDPNCREWEAETDLGSGQESINGSCLVCNHGFQIDTNDSRVCLATSVVVDCEEADQYFSPEEGACVESKDNCQVWDYFDGRCVKCFDGFILTDWSCACPKEEEKEHSGNLIRQSSSNMVCGFSNCERVNYLNPQRCERCKEGFSIDKASQKCIYEDIPENCDAFDLNTFRCKQCLSAFVLSANQQNCFPVIQNCQQYNQVNGLCVNCAHNDFYRVSADSTSCVKVVENCLRYSPINDSCLQCSEGFQLQSEQNSSQIFCVESAVDMQVSEIYGCETWSFEDEKCTECEENFTNSAIGYCFFDDDHCLERNSRSFCLKCKQGYTIVNGNCQLTLKDGNSTLNRHQNNENRKGCKIFDWVSNDCLVCDANFEYYRQQTQNEANPFTAGHCIMPETHCTKFSSKAEDSSPRCTECAENYDLVNGECVSIAVSRCIEFSVEDATVCIQCQSGLVLLNGQCKTLQQLGSYLLDYNEQSIRTLRQKMLIFTDEKPF